MPALLIGTDRPHRLRRMPPPASPWVRVVPQGGEGGPVVIRRYRFHDSFLDPEAPRRYGPTDDEADDVPGHLPDDATRDLVRRMHYAAYRAHQARRLSEAEWWQGRYVALRNAVIAGNRKLAFRAVGLLRLPPHRADDLAGELLLVLVRAVACFDPWLGTRFSTYACLCLKRTLHRLRRRDAAQPRWTPLLGDLDAATAAPDDATSLERCRSVVSDLLRHEPAFLSSRERTVLLRRFYPPAGQKRPTLAALSREFGLSKERVRQIQAQAVGKLRRELLRRLPHDLRFEIVG